MSDLVSSDAIRGPLCYLNTSRKHCKASQITALQTGTQGALICVFPAPLVAPPGCICRGRHRSNPLKQQHHSMPFPISLSGWLETEEKSKSPWYKKSSLVGVEMSSLSQLCLWSCWGCQIPIRLSSSAKGASNLNHVSSNQLPQLGATSASPSGNCPETFVQCH